MGTLFVIEGGEGVGKSTVIQKLQASFPDMFFTREPGGTPVGEELRTLVLSDWGKHASQEVLHELFWAARAYHWDHVIEPRLSRGQSVVCDRFDGSTFAYQVQHRLSPLNADFWKRRKLLGNMAPVYVLLDVDARVAQERVNTRGGVLTHFDAKKLEEHQAIRAGFLAFARLLKEEWGPGVVHVVDAGRTPEEVYAEVEEIVRRAHG